MQGNDETQDTANRHRQQALQYALEREQWSQELQQQSRAHHRTEVEQLKLRLEQVNSRNRELQQALQRVSAERDEARRRLTESDTRPRRGGRIAAALSTLVLAGTLFTVVAFHDAQSSVENHSQPALAAAAAADERGDESDSRNRDSDRSTTPQTGKRKTRLARAADVSSRQWGPALWMPDPDAPKPRTQFDPEVKTLQQNLLSLGFDIGAADGFNGTRTRQAVEEFRALYLPDGARQVRADDLAVIIANYASLARADAARFGVDQGVVAAIRLSSIRTGVEFSYLMKLAATESNFRPDSEAGSSSATGLYQFTRDTWLNTLKRHGDNYGLGDYTASIEYYITRGGFRRPMVRDKALLGHLLALRKNPRISSMMAAESVRDNQKRLAYSLDRKPAQTDLYLTHFLGADGAIAFLKALEENPDTFAVDIFPEAARSNASIFHPKTCDPRTVDEVYELFGEKFSTRRFDDLAAN